MTAKTFRAPTTQDAFDMIQQELGPEAIIVSVRQVPSDPAWQSWKRPEVEVLAIPGNSGTSASSLKIEQADPPSQPASRLPTTLPHANKPAPPALAALKQMSTPSREDIETLLLSLATRSAPRENARRTTTPDTPRPHLPVATHTEKKPQPSAPEPILPIEGKVLSRAQIRVQSQLLSQGVEPTLVERLLSTCFISLSPVALGDENRVRAHVRSQMEAHVHISKIEALHGDANSSNRVIFFIGPSGAGKTSTCAKLATFAASKLKKKVVWVSADTVRAGAISLARTYTEPLGIDLHLAYTPEDLGKIVSSQKDADLILVDTPACNPFSDVEVIGLGATLTVVPDRTTLLVVPASAKESDQHGMTVAFGAYNLKGLVVTKLDETNTYGNLFSLICKTRLPLTMLTHGPRVLGDMQMASSKTFSGLFFGEKPIKT